MRGRSDAHARVFSTLHRYSTSKSGRQCSSIRLDTARRTRLIAPKAPSNLPSGSHPARIDQSRIITDCTLRACSSAAPRPAKDSASTAFGVKHAARSFGCCRSHSRSPGTRVRKASSAEDWQCCWSSPTIWHISGRAQELVPTPARLSSALSYTDHVASTCWAVGILSRRASARASTTSSSRRWKMHGQGCCLGKQPVVVPQLSQPLAPCIAFAGPCPQRRHVWQPSRPARMVKSAGTSPFKKRRSVVRR